MYKKIIIQIQVAFMSRSFNIKQTVNKNIETNQFPAFTNHRSMVGWCSMNYPKVLVNPIYMKKQSNVPDEKKYDINSMFQQKNPIDREVVQFHKPFTNYKPKVEDGKPQIKEQGTKTSSLTLATVNHGVKVSIYEQNNQLCEEYSAVKPLGNILGPDNDRNFERKVRQIGEVFYNPPNEGEQMRHLKKLPNTVINEQNLVTLLSPSLEYLDIQYKEDIPNDLINKIGYLAPNIKHLNLTAVPIENNVLIELGKSCKHLESIDISKCDEIQEFAILTFLKDCPKLKGFSVNHMDHAISDACLECFKENECIQKLSVNFCYQLTSAGFEFLEKKTFVQLGLSNLPNIKGEDIIKLISSSTESLTYLDISYNVEKDINNAMMAKVGQCSKLEELSLTGCEKIGDDGITNLKGKQGEGLPNLRTLKVGSLNLSDSLHHVFKRCPNISFLEANNLERLSQNFLDHLKNYPGEKTVLLNFTPNIPDEKVKEIKDTCKHLKIIRKISKMTDPADDGLRMPIPPASLKVKKPKKAKKK